jgi:hypothetical protein
MEIKFCRYLKTYTKSYIAYPGAHRAVQKIGEVLKEEFGLEDIYDIHVFMKDDGKVVLEVSGYDIEE